MVSRSTPSPQEPERDDQSPTGSDAEETTTTGAPSAERTDQEDALLDEDALIVDEDETLDVEDDFIADETADDDVDEASEAAPADADSADSPDSAGRGDSGRDDDAGAAEDGAPDDADSADGQDDDAPADDAGGAGSGGIDDAIPFELKEDLPDPEDEPKTGLVSELRELTFNQAAWLVSNREAGAAARSPLYLIPTLLIILGVMAGLAIGIARDQGAGDAGDSTLAVVGISDEAQIAQFEQAYGFSVLAVESPEAAEQAVRAGDADAALLPDTTGMGAPQIIALNEEPTAILEAINPPQEVIYLETPAIGEPLSTAFAWGLALLLVLSATGLGTAMFANLLVERRNRIGEVLAAAVPPRAAAWGRVYGATALSLSHLAIGYVLLVLGLSIAGRTEIVMAALPTLGWFAALFALTVFLYVSLLLASASAVGQRARKIGYGIVTGLLVLASLAPLLLERFTEVLYWLSFAPLTSPVAMSLRLMGGSAEWWEPLIAVGVTLVVGIIAYLIGQRGYLANMLRGAGRGGRVAVAKRDRKAAKAQKGKSGVKTAAGTAAGASAAAGVALSAEDDGETDSAADSAAGQPGTEDEPDADDPQDAADEAKDDAGDDDPGTGGDIDDDSTDDGTDDEPGDEDETISR
ncbi:ABC transporter permease [Sediminivirga luteola]|uniref:ABC-type Na+ efflux pump permease subunit n=1 Tax=Sediminivirga luteola TaxID=1774748 RepID=A0A8J2XJ10_9MICO|nr:ABC transporter permease [Sediminivirga luteola]GGA05041.1 hypothetical protein GCM10011333_04630 [Sediminivirga luteola]